MSAPENLKNGLQKRERRDQNSTKRPITTAKIHKMTD